MNIGDRIRTLRQQHNETQEELGNIIGTTKQNLYKYETGIITNIPLDKIEKIANHYDVSPGYLMGWNTKHTHDTSIEKIPGITPLTKIKRIPILGTIACGEPIFAEQNYDGYFVADSTIKNADFILRCKGDSMIDANIHDGDLIFLKQTSDVENGQIAAVLINNEATLKKINKTKDFLILQPCNEKYDVKVINPSECDTLCILGVMVGVYSERDH